MAKKEPSPIHHSANSCIFAVVLSGNILFDMPRQARKRSNIGLYHVMLRGINRNAIFHDDMDLRKMLKILKEVSSPTERNNEMVLEGCAIHAYCLMSNHIHLLIEERNESIDRTMKRIGVAYVSYYNKKYERIGPLFQGRFRSEPVDDAAYFLNLMAYIHLNPVKAGIVSSPSNYQWSSWNEYMSPDIDRGCEICDLNFPFQGLTVNELRQTIAHNNELKPFIPFARESRRMTDEEAIILAHEVMPKGIRNMSDLPRSQRIAILRDLYHKGLGFSQISRLAGISETTVRRYAK